MDIPWVGVGGVLLACFIYTQAKGAGIKKGKATAIAIVGAYVGGVAIVLVAQWWPVIF